jgi:hypothetical protein
MPLCFFVFISGRNDNTSVHWTPAHDSVVAFMVSADVTERNTVMNRATNGLFMTQWQHDNKRQLMLRACCCPRLLRCLERPESSESNSLFCNQSTKAASRITTSLWSVGFSQKTRAYVGPSLVLIKRWLHLTSRDSNIIGNQDLIRLLQFVNEQTVEDVVKIDIKRLRFPALSHSCLQKREKLLLRALRFRSM